MTPELPSTAQSCLSHIRSIRTTLQLPCVYFPHAPQISGLLPRLSITFLLPAPPRSPQPFLPVPPTLGLQFLENAHLGSPADSPISSCPHGCLSVSSPVSRRVLACFSACPHRLGVLTRLVVSSPVSGVFLPVLACPHLCLGVSSPVSACPHPSRRPLLLLSSAGTPSTCPQRRQGVARGSTNRQMCSQ